MNGTYKYVIKIIVKVIILSAFKDCLSEKVKVKDKCFRQPIF